MLEGLATWFLNNYLGNYLQNLNTDQLSIGLLQGEVELENVPLRRDALRFLDPALEVRSGFVGHIRLSIPVARLRSEPWTLLLEKVYIVVGPQKFKDYDEEADDQVRVETKLAALDDIEGEWRAVHDNTEEGSYYPTYSSWLSYGTSFIGTIVENLQLKIKDVHVRYEDDVTVPGAPYAAGFTLESLAAETCDETWSPKFVHRDAAAGELTAYKIVELTNMAAYLDTSATMLGAGSIDQLAAAMSVASHAGHSHVLNPVSATATLKRHCSGRPLNSRKLARNVAHVQVRELSLDLTNTQYQLAIAAARTVHTMRTSRRWWRYRPGMAVAGNARQWWKFAITCTLHEVHKRREAATWDSVIRAAKDNVVYVQAFMAQLENPASVPDWLQVVKQAQDTARSYEELKAVREIAVYRLKKQKGEIRLRNADTIAMDTGGESEIADVVAEITPVSDAQEQGGQSRLKSWFPLWGGWYSQAPKESALDAHRETSPPAEDSLLDALADDADTIIVAYKDVVFSHVSILLKHVALRLTSNNEKISTSPGGKLLFEVEFANLKVEHESRPRMGSMMFGLHVGAVYLRDKITPKSLFPVLISPQNSEGAPLHAKAPQTRFGGLARSFQSFLPSALGPSKEIEESLLDLLYEQKPFSSKADYRLHIKSQPLDIVYNPIVIKYLSEFFKIPEDINQTSHLSEKIRSAALTRLEQAKRRTKEEFTRNINEILEGHAFDRKIWDVMLDLSAPQLLIPEHFEDKQAHLMVIDFGKMKLTNQNTSIPKSQRDPIATSPRSTTQMEDDDDDDIFVTPSSSPGTNSPPISPGSKSPLRKSAKIEPEQVEPLELGEAFLQNKMYDRYAIDFNNMQIIVGQVKDNWKGAHMKGNSSLHIVDRFSICMQVSRRTVETSDPAWPSVLVSAMLPKLMFHVNEEKLVTVQRMLSQLAGPGTGTRADGSSQTENGDLDATDEETLALFSGWQPKNQVDVTSKLLFAHFCVSDLSVEVQSQGKSVAELQVTNMKAGVTRRPYDTNLVMSVHSLLLVDAMQTFGPDYELLVASHRHVTVDSVSGSLRGSDPQSPNSPGSPEPNMQSAVSAHDINQALSSISGGESPILRQQSSNSGYLSPDSVTLPCISPNAMGSRSSLPTLPMDVLDPNALISVDIMLVSPSCPTVEDHDKLQIINIQFNSLDVIANQETIIELLGFTRRVFPKSGAYQPQYSNTSLVTTEIGCQTDPTENSLSQRKTSNANSTLSRSIRTTTRTELTAEFQRLNVLLLRAVTGRRTGTALLTDARIHATKDQALSASGSLGGLQVMNLISSSPVHQRIISVGREPLVEEHLKDQATCLHSLMYPQYCPSEETKHAFTFSICQQVSVVNKSMIMMEGFNSCNETNYNSCTPSGYNSLVGTPKLDFDPFSASAWVPDLSPDNSNTVKVSLHMSSVVYTHSSVFLEEMNSCAEDFKRYMSTLAQSITSAAAEMALGIVHRRTEAIITAPSFTVGRDMTPPHRPRSDTASSLQRPIKETEGSFSSSYRQSDFVRPPAPTPRTLAQARKVNVNLELDMVLETPVVVFPRIESGFEVLVAHLGQITVKNHILGRNDIDGDIGLPVGTNRVDRYIINVHDMNLNSLNLQTKFKKSNVDSIVTQIKFMTAQDLYSSLKHGVPILHDTKIEVCVDEIKKSNIMRESQSMNSFMFMEDFFDLSFIDEEGQTTSFQIQGKVVNQLKVSLSRSQYQQVLDTIKSPGAAEQEGDVKLDDINFPKETNDLPNTSAKKFSNAESKKPTPIEGSFELPLFSLELRGDMINNSQLETGLVSLACTDFAITYEKFDSDTTNLQMALKGLIMEDLLQDENSPHRTLMISSACPPSLIRPKTGIDVMSTSCPDVRSKGLFFQGKMSTSLPDRLDTKMVFGGDYNMADIRKRSGPKMERNQGTRTPPPSACTSPIFGETVKRDLKSEENLVHLNASLIDANSSEFLTKHKGTNKFVDVDFNSVDINFNLQTWVVILDFFGIGSAPGPEPVTIKTTVTSVAKQEHDNTELDIRVKCLSIVFNKNSDDLFKATVLNYVSQISLRDGNCTIDGRLGNFCIKDLTPHGLLYRDRFLCRGEQILNFKIFKYGQPDDLLQRDFDISVKLRMSAITYVHTQRFFTVLTEFFQQFQQLQAFMNTFREESVPRNQGVGFKTADKIAGRGSRILLDVEAGAPLLILPMSSYSANVLMVDLGFLEINNKFMFAGDEGTISAIKLGSIKSCELGARRSRATYGSGSSARSRSTARSASRRSRASDHERGMSSDATGDEGESSWVNRHKCLLDVMFIHLRSMDLNTAQRLSAFISEEERRDNDVNIGSCLIRKQNKPLLKANCELKLQVERNLDKAFCHYVPDLSIRGLLSKVHAAVDVDQYKIIRGFLAYNLGEHIDQQDDVLDTVVQVAENNFGELWTTTFMDIELQNVTVDLVQAHQILPHAPESGLARINFIKSRLVYESFSDFSKDVDLVSQEILLIDTRFADFPMNKRSNVFTCILQPMASVERTSLLQAEVHFRATNDVNRFTILLNNMRLMGIFDWWLTVYAFISKNSDNPQNLKEEEFEHEKNVETKMINLYDEPLYPSSGVVSRRHPVIQTSGPVFELKLNVTDSELVVVADTSQWESSAVILRSTTVLAFRPALKERPLSCNLNNAEVFSCVLGKEEETALSIIDPVTINLEVWCRTDAPSVSKGLLDMTDEEVERVAEIQLQQLNIRLSYHDWIMFRHILNSLPQQLQDAIAGSEVKDPDLVAQEEPANMRLQIGQLAALGFSRSDCLQALQVSAGQLDEAALWLTQNANPSKAPVSTVVETSESGQFLEKSPISFFALYLKTSCINLVVIDDCKDADCPLFEISIASLNLRQKYNGNGFLSSTLSASYYNRALSAWEPCMEPWLCGVDWNANKIPSGFRNEVRIKATDTINLNITSTLIELYDMVRKNWGEDYYNLSKEDQGNAVQTPPAFRIRTPFVPYSIHNDTGCNLWFSTHVLNADSRPVRHASGHSLEGEEKPKWREVENGETVSFEFESRTKQRHMRSRQHQIHQVVVRVNGWQEVKPVSVDRVGTFFRGAVASRGTIPSDTPPVRLVFQVTLEGSARKLVTVRSALQVENLLPVPIQIKMNNRALKLAEELVINLAPKKTIPVPLLYCWADMVARPVMASICQWKYSDKAIHWCHIINSCGNTLELFTSEHAWNAKNEPYRFCVAVRRLGYPQESLAIGPSGPLATSSAWVQPAHVITFLPPVTLVNLLPAHLQYSVQGVPGCGTVKPGKESCLLLDTSYMFILDFSLESFPNVGSLIMHPGSGEFEARIKLSDNLARPLYISVKVSIRYGGVININVYAPYWIVNKTGLPVLFRQDGEKAEAAGQFEEHELARMVAPLLFSFAERDSNLSLVARVGIGLHPGGRPSWCKNFYVQTGSKVRRLRVAPPAQDSRPEWVYIIGIDVRPGKGRYQLTTIITLSPRFQLYNHSPHRIQFSQQCFASSFHDPGAEKTYLTAHPQSSLAFHWPRLDMDQLLSIRLIDVPGSQWSGGFLIENVDSFQLTLRDRNGRSRFLRVEISLESSTYCIAISSADNFPPPFRIDNFSEVGITFYQTGISDQVLRSVVKPHQSVPYAWDAPVLPPHLTVSAPGGSAATYNMNVIGAGSQLTYENFIYIAVSGTFEGIPGDNFDVTSLQLVLDVSEGSRVGLSRKSGAKRSQLWRMTSTGMLQHEGSSPPCDPKYGPDHSRILVLDIAGPAVQPGEYVPLMLRKPDQRRTLTQRWRFTDVGRLQCQHNGLFVQVKDGFANLGTSGQWMPWQEVVLGPPSSVCLQRTSRGIPIEQALCRQRLRPGSGFLGVTVTTDGPTRVLQITDLKQAREKSFARVDDPEWVDTRRPRLVTADGGGRRDEKVGAGVDQLQVVVTLKGGLGVSLVSKDPSEELVYAFLTNIVMDYQSLPTAQLLDGSVQNIQVDSQLADCQMPVVLYLSPSNKTDDGRHLPAIHFAMHRNRNPNNATPNAEIFKHFILTIKNMTINIEEELLCKICKFAHLALFNGEQEGMGEDTNWDQHLTKIALASQLTRFYFGAFKLTLNQIKLSVLKSNKLNSELREIKRKLGLSLITFEDATIELEQFSRTHPFETLPFLKNSIIKHYQDELLSQAVLILGSTDFLGNPIGFLNDVSEGVSGLVSDGDLGGLVKNVAHGGANSISKILGSASSGIGRATLDEKYDERRLMIRKKHSESSQQHLVAGLKGFGFGVLGGLTSWATEPIEGAAQDGLAGFVSGLGRGVVSTISKPTIGVLDLFTGAASAVRESSRASSRAVPPKLRPVRVVAGPGGALPPYSEKTARGQEYLYRINGKNYGELFVGYEVLRTGLEDLRVVVSSERVVVFSQLEDGRDKAVLTVGYCDLQEGSTRVVSAKEGGKDKFYIELGISAGQARGLVTPPRVNRPQVRCDSEQVAQIVCSQINYARTQWEEMRQALPAEEEGDWEIL